MKKLIPALLLLLFSCSVLFSWRTYRNYAPDFEDMAEFDPSRYESECTYSMQTFLLKPHDRNWFLSSMAHYNAENAMDYEIVYELDGNGQAYYMNNGKRFDVSQMPRPGFQDLNNIFKDGNIINECFDEYGRMVSRTVTALPRTQTAQLYYATDSGECSGDDAISTFVITTNFKNQPDEEPIMYVGSDECPCWETTAYYIANLDQYGNETYISFGDANCYLKTDTDGYLQMIILDNTGSYVVYRVDKSGRPLWNAVYSKDSGEVLESWVWNYIE